MPKWINLEERSPEKPGNYYVKINGAKNLYTYDEILKFQTGYDTFLWLDESTENIKLRFLSANGGLLPDKPQRIIGDIANGSISKINFEILSNYFGIRKAKSIIKSIKSKVKENKQEIPYEFNKNGFR